jgi:hypothetical protein
MRTVLFITAMIGGVVCTGLVPAEAAPQPMSGIAATKVQVGPVENVGWRRRYWRRYGYAVPYAYYPPAYGYYPRYYVHPAYPYYAPYVYRYHWPYYAPY